MMRNSLLMALIVVFIAACNSNTPQTATGDSTVAPVNNGLDLKRLAIGHYTGDFGGAPIHIIINFVEEKFIAGYNTHKGNRRNVSGTIEADGDKWKVILNEPGSHEYDGVFTLIFDKDFANATGSWKPFSDSLSAKQFKLVRHNIDDNDPKSFMESNSYYDGNHTLSFYQDGSCEIAYYPIKADSTKVLQQVIVKGTYKYANEKYYINWGKEGFNNRRADTFLVKHTKPDPNNEYESLSITNADLELMQNEF
ncbi:hypothetical protein LX64_00538 [Chitinophaga skermanii]|uniref:Uncharacterized protein n=1 Tax=Chitinophaga skermanii TaxID=331697 RepID=A0A327R2S4_9BACT|nr:hypothetical protein [Chitinophaga skermanii]RAJ10931.1 hypothetical protein LX64_00538 [Chitinophaga skermanii]